MKQFLSINRFDLEELKTTKFHRSRFYIFHVLKGKTNRYG